MRRHTADEILAIKELRSHGYCIDEIAKRLCIPKTTIWNHIRKVRVPIKLARILNSQRGGSHLKKLARLESARKSAIGLLAGPKKFQAGVLAAIYWAEGNKRDMTFTNTDPSMVRLFLSLTKLIFALDNNSIKITVRYFTGMRKDECLGYWSKITGIPKNHIYMYYNDGGNRGKTPYGICRATVRKGGHVLKIVQALAVEITKMPLSFKG